VLWKRMEKLVKLLGLSNRMAFDFHFETSYFLASFENISFSCLCRDDVLDATISSTQQKDAIVNVKLFHV
jgi:hypothetical protein